jgi:hypothetical protein
MMIDRALGGLFRVASVAALALLSGNAAGCGPACVTAAGCDSGLIVLLQPIPPLPFRLEVLGGPTSSRRMQLCDQTSLCGSGQAYFVNLVSKQAVIEVIVGTDTTRREFKNIAYSKSEPNGEDCDPTCFNAQVTFATASSPQQ